MKHFVYIIHSQSTDKFYVGETLHVPERIVKHNSGHFHHASTKFATDWELFLQIECESGTQARKIERHIKKMKSRKYYEDLARYPEMTVMLLRKFSS
jgi:putative endonuclease